MAGVELEPFRLEALGGATLMSLARIYGAAAPDHRRRPWLCPEALQTHRVLVDPDRVERIARQGPGAGLRVEIGKQTGFRILA